MAPVRGFILLFAAAGVAVNFAGLVGCQSAPVPASPGSVGSHRAVSDSDVKTQTQVASKKEAEREAEAEAVGRAVPAQRQAGRSSLHEDASVEADGDSPLRIQCTCPATPEEEARAARIVGLVTWRGLSHSYAVIGQHVLEELERLRQHSPDVVNGTGHLDDAAGAAARDSIVVDDHGFDELAVFDAPLYNKAWAAQQQSIAAPAAGDSSNTKDAGDADGGRAVAGTIHYAYNVTAYYDEASGVLRPPPRTSAERAAFKRTYVEHAPPGGRSASIERAPPLCPGVMIRIQFPLDLSPAPCRALTYTYGTTESGVIADEAFAFQRRAWASLSRRQFLLTPSHWSARGFRDAQVDPGRLVIWPNGVDPHAFRPLPEPERRALRETFGWATRASRTSPGDDDFVFLSVGHMRQNKGVAYMLYGAFKTAAWLRQQRRSRAAGLASTTQPAVDTASIGVQPSGSTTEAASSDALTDFVLPRAIRLRLKGSDEMYDSASEVASAKAALRRQLARASNEDLEAFDSVLSDGSLVVEYTGERMADEQLVQLHQVRSQS